MKKQVKTTESWSTSHKPLGLLLGLLTGLLTLPVISSLDNLPVIVQLGVSTALGITVYFSYATAKKRKNNSVDKKIGRAVALLIILCAIASVVCLVRSLYINPADIYGGDKFVLQNTATGLAFVAIFLSLLLSALQKDVYWISRSKTNKLDEREIKERQEVFETSYKIGAWFILISLVIILNLYNDLPQFLANNHGNISDFLFWPFYVIIIVIFALPLMVAALRKNNP